MSERELQFAEPQNPDYSWMTICIPCAKKLQIVYQINQATHQVIGCMGPDSICDACGEENGGGVVKVLKKDINKIRFVSAIPIEMALKDSYDMYKMYMDPIRIYHNIDHILYMFMMAKELKMNLNVVQKLAIVFHDIIYTRGDPKNEIESAEYALLVLEKYRLNKLVTQEQIESVLLCILSTICHNPLCENAKKVIDLDLIILAMDYKKYKKLVRNEYSGISDNDWYFGRRSFLERMIQKNQIFFSDQCIPFEQEAKNNLQQEMDDLQH